MRSSHRRIVFSVCLSVLALVLCAMFPAAEQSAKGFKGERSENFKDVKTVEEAVALARKHLTASGRTEYAALLSEARVRAAVRSAVKSYEVSAMAISEKRFPGSKDHFENAVKPVCLRIADKGEWPAGCSIDAYFGLVDKRNGETVSYDGMGLGLTIETPDATLKGFRLPILTVFFGRFEPPCE